MVELLPRLLARGAAGKASGADHRILDYLARPEVNRRAFGQPLAGTLGYYLAEYLCLATSTERFARQNVKSS